MTYTRSRSGEITVGPFPKGMNNKANDFALPEGSARNIVNADLNTRGQVSLRPGSTKVYSGNGVSNGFSCAAGSFLTEQDQLKQFNTDTTVTTLGSVNGDYIAYWYDKANDAVYLSDGVSAYKIKDGVLQPWGLSLPNSIVLGPSVGEYSGGLYVGTVTYVDINNVESGAAPVSSILTSNDTGITFYNLPTPSDPTVYKIRLYLSMANGSELYHIVDLLPGSSTYNIRSGVYDDANILESLDVIPPLAGQVICTYSGRAYVAKGSLIVYSEPFEYDRFRNTNNIQGPEEITIMAPVSSGMFIGTMNKTYFYSGQPNPGFSIEEVLPYGAIPNTFKALPDKDAVIWQSQRGLVMGTKDGSITNIQEENVATETGASGAILIKNQNGKKQVIAAINSPRTSGLAASSFIEAEIIRRS